MFEDHPSIQNIRAKNFKSIFSFTHTNKTEIKKIIRGMNVHKTCQLKVMFHLISSVYTLTIV